MVPATVPNLTTLVRPKDFSWQVLFHVVDYGVDRSRVGTDSLAADGFVVRVRQMQTAYLQDGLVLGAQCWRIALHFLPLAAGRDSGSSGLGLPRI